MYLLPIICFGTLSFGQVGVNNVVPKSTLDVQSKTIDGSRSEGFLLPRVTGNALHDAEAAGVYGADQDVTLVYVTQEPDPDNRIGQTEGMDSPGFYYFNAGSNRWVKMLASGINTAAITQLVCSSSSDIGILQSGVAAAGVNTVIPYNGGNGGVYSAISIPSIGVTGLTAVLPSGTLNHGSGSLNFTIIGTPSGVGTAVFTLDIGGETCGFSRNVQAGGSFTDVVDVIVNGQTRQMMTRNLGADPTKDPNTPVQAIFGNFYQWGKLNPVATAYTAAGSIPGWYTSHAPNRSWNSGTEAVPIKTAKDPCPSGFRIPTRNEWVGFNNASTNSNIGTWATGTTDGATNFTAAKVFVNNGNTLTFPIVGQRNYYAGGLINRSFAAGYWSSTENGSGQGFSMTLISSAVNPSNINTTRSNGFALRCISQ
ncbi:FISUMP domain-containing protein [Chryseobacterium rhizoplanae]|uniref:FISUMP domain-containing protein n=1 Tax=Chryseobacterium rhizoplanae TaxID=1609531 RepID=UPI00142EC672|nr:FISUMP domain-containing protein [Chryseobacterium rhizoplanae]